VNVLLKCKPLLARALPDEAPYLLILPVFLGFIESCGWGESQISYAPGSTGRGKPHNPRKLDVIGIASRRKPLL
jgi:hypothetical protein